MGEQLFHDEVVVNLPGQFAPFLHRFEFFEAFDLRNEQGKLNSIQSVREVSRVILSRHGW